MEKDLRRMKTFTPRRRRSRRDLQLQRIEDFSHLLEMDMGSFLILAKEGSTKQAEVARNKLQADIKKYGPDMQVIARDLGEGFPDAVSEYLKKTALVASSQDQSMKGQQLEAQRKIALELIKRAKGAMQIKKAA